MKVVAAVAAGRSYRAVSKDFGVSPPTAMRWFHEARAEETQLVSDAVQAIKDGHPIELVARAARVRREIVWTWLRASLPSVRRRTKNR